MQIKVKDISGKEVKTIDLPESIYGVEMNEHVLHTVVKGYQANRRQGTHATKTRAFVSGGGKKPFKQKGTGGARAGSTRSPLWPGGAVTHGPQPRDYTQKMNKKMRNLAMRVALSDKVRHGKLVVVSDFAISKYSTKQVLKAMGALDVESAVLTDERKDDFLLKSARNINRMAVKSPADLNVEDILRHESLVISENGINALHQRLEGGSHASV